MRPERWQLHWRPTAWTGALPRPATAAGADPGAGGKYAVARSSSNNLKLAATLDNLHSL